MKMNMWCMALFLGLMLSPLKNVFAQQDYYHGKVADHQSEEPLPFVSVSFVKAKKGVITDSAGNFILAQSIFGLNDTLIIESVGYTTLFIPVSKLNGKK